jgi:hypothetical protein
MKPMNLIHPHARWCLGPVATALAAGFLSLPVQAADAEIDRVRATTTKLINMLLEQGLITRAKADELLKEMDAPAARPAAPATAAAPVPAPATTVRVPFVPEFVRKEIKDELRAELSAQARQEGWAGPGAVPAWVRGLRWEGDLRSRLQSDNFDAANAAAISITETNRTRALTLANTTEDRQRLRVRARLGMAVTADSNWSGNVRLSSGSTTDPVSSNQTLGNYGNRFTVAFDRASIRYRQGGSFNMVAGRFGNPWFGTDLVFDSDLAFDGVAAQWTPLVSTWGKAFVTAAAMPVQEVELSSADKWLYGVQVGMEWPGRGLVSGKVGVGYYHFSNLVGKANAAGSSLNDFTAPAFAQKGNTYFNISSDPTRPLLALASDYRLVNLTGSIGMVTIGYKNLVLTADYVKNLGFKEAQVSARVGTNVAAETDGYLLRASLGDEDVDAAHRWQVFFSYKNLKRDAVLDAFADSSLRGGGTDVKGYSLGGSYGLGKNTAATLLWLSGDSVSGAPLSLDSLRLDFSIRF